MGKNVNLDDRVKLLDKLIENNFSEYFNSLCINGMKDRYYVFILRFRHVPFVLKMDAFIYHIVKLKKINKMASEM